MPQLLVADLGRMEYAVALELQRAVAKARIAGTIAEDVLLLMEHPPVVTLGRSSKRHYLHSSREELASRGIELFEAERGGEVTFHGPGQLIGYPIIDLKRHEQDLHWYLRRVEEALILAVAPLGIVGERSVGQTGVWTNGRKLASIGVHARDWVTWHGFALNVTTDLSYFDVMVPCGIDGVAMTSVSAELKHRDAKAVVPNELGAHVCQLAADCFAEVFSLEAVPIDALALARLLTSALAQR